MGVPGSGEDFLDDDGDDEEFIDTTAEEVPTRAADSSTSQSEAPRSPAGRSKRLVRIKPLSPALASKFPGVTTILVTRNDGSQILFVQQKGS